jgi:hypothetical protein
MDQPGDRGLLEEDVAIAEILVRKFDSAWAELLPSADGEKFRSSLGIKLLPKRS